MVVLSDMGLKYFRPFQRQLFLRQLSFFAKHLVVHMWLSILNPSVPILFMLGLMQKLLSWDQREQLTLFIIKRFQKVRIQKKQEIKRLKNIRNDLLTLILPQVLAWLMM